MDQEEITVLANSVYEFKEALKKLTNIFNRDESVQGYTSNEDSQQMYDFINQLATAFSIRVSEYLVGDLDIYVSPHLEVTSSSTSVDKNDNCSKKAGSQQALPYGSQLPIQMTTFGVELEQQLRASGTAVPHIVTKCVQEIDDRGILVKGIYRVSGVKSKVEKLCQEFETDGENVELSCVHPNVIANVLKLYLRQLPQPLFTFNLYPEFVRFAKHWPCGSNKELSTAVEELRKIIMKLPKNYYNTVKIIVQHLKRVSNQDDINNMSPSNLGIVFGPTLLRTSDGQSSINSLVDTVYQSRAIELIITWADQLFIA
ncbi:rho GTPase-activating protein 45-like isoform X2 [Lycorma delicatula]|uniref:rho GTPase-activating protein 45-like isoform X2 n=1 Tax=Lycorma delicatula TaxID=130591 RepID=UPI003F51A1C5